MLIAGNWNDLSRGRLFHRYFPWHELLSSDRTMMVSSVKPMSPSVSLVPCAISSHSCGSVLPSWDQPIVSMVNHNWLECTKLKRINDYALDPRPPLLSVGFIHDIWLSSQAFCYEPENISEPWMVNFWRDGWQVTEIWWYSLHACKCFCMARQLTDKVLVISKMALTPLAFYWFSSESPYVITLALAMQDPFEAHKVNS